MPFASLLFAMVLGLLAEEPRQPADSLAGTPFVSAKAWAILDGTNGKLLYGDGADAPRDMASTTKMMTAWIVAEFVNADAKVLDEAVTFSKRADDTVGSSAEIKAGEKISVRHLLRGMLLPSGNDAAVAFAEHFGARTKAAKALPSGADPLASFVAEMNRQAKELGLAHTHFENPHGLTAKGHQSSPHDLGLLALKLLQSPLLREVVNTRSYRTTATQPDGTPREVSWANTNNLLKIDGYNGVKTGTTNAAGACLVASGERGKDKLIVVILGSAGSDARYSDARNLFRWAWNQRGHKR